MFIMWNKVYAVLSENLARHKLRVFRVLKKIFWNHIRVKFVTNCMSAYAGDDDLNDDISDLIPGGLSR